MKKNQKLWIRTDGGIEDYHTGDDAVRVYAAIEDAQSRNAQWAGPIFRDDGIVIQYRLDKINRIEWWDGEENE